MIKEIAAVLVSAMSAFMLSGCGNAGQAVDTASAQKIINTVTEGENIISKDKYYEADFKEFYTRKTKISDVINDPDFGDYGRMIFPVDEGFYSGDTLEELRLTWYSNIDPDKTVEITNYMKNYAENGSTIFYDIYTDEEKAADPEKADTGLFFFFFLRAMQAKNLRYAMRAAVLHMWAQCRTAFPMRWNCRKRATMLLR